MIKANFNTYNNYVTDSLYQWDKDQDLIINGLNLTVAPEIHFANANMDRAIVRQSTLSSNVVTVRIPNSLLQEALTIRAYVGVYEDTTFNVIEVIEIPVIAKARPSDYSLTDTDEEIYSFIRLENEIANMVPLNTFNSTVEGLKNADKSNTDKLSAQIANIVANASETGDNAELIDIRTGADGKVYPSAGDAVRGQIDNIKSGRGIDYKTISPYHLNFADNIIEQMINPEELTNGYYRRGASTVAESTTAYICNPIRIKKGIPFRLYNVYGYFSTIIYDDGTKKSISDETWGAVNYHETPTKDGILYVSITQSNLNTAMAIMGTVYYSGDYFVGVKQLQIPGLVIPDLNLLKTRMNYAKISNIIYVDPTITENDDRYGITHFPTVISAINYTQSQDYNYWDIYVYTGTYDILEELGGDTFIENISVENGQRQGLQLPNNVNLIGIGHVVLDFELPDTVTYDQSKCVSCINLMGSNRVENIHFKAKNCRYVCHDEMNNNTHHIKRMVKNCVFEHLGNVDGLWEWFTAYGAGTGSGCKYEFYDCEFYSPSKPFGLHTNYNQDPCILIMDRVVATGGSSNVSIGITSYGTNHNGKSKAFIGKVITDKEIATGLEAGGTEYHWTLFNFN